MSDEDDLSILEDDFAQSPGPVITLANLPHIVSMIVDGDVGADFGPQRFSESA